jgi:hypothetical protein
MWNELRIYFVGNLLAKNDFFITLGDPGVSDDYHVRNGLTFSSYHTTHRNPASLRSHAIEISPNSRIIVVTIFFKQCILYPGLHHSLLRTIDTKHK